MTQNSYSSQSQTLSCILHETHFDHESKWQTYYNGSCQFCLACSKKIWDDQNELPYRKRHLLKVFLQSIKTCSKYVDVLMSDESFDDQMECPVVLTQMSNTLISLICDAQSNQIGKDITTYASQCLVHILTQTSVDKLCSTINQGIISIIDCQNIETCVNQLSLIGMLIQSVPKQMDLFMNYRENNLLNILCRHFTSKTCSDQVKLKTIEIFIQVYGMKVWPDFFDLDINLHKSVAQICVIGINSKIEDIMLGSLSLSYSLSKIAAAIPELMQDQLVSAIKFVLQSGSEAAKICASQLIGSMSHHSNQPKELSQKLVSLIHTMFNLLSNSESILLSQSLICALKIILENVDSSDMSLSISSHPSFAVDAISDTFSTSVKLHNASLTHDSMDTLRLLFTKSSTSKIMNDFQYHGTLDLLFTTIKRPESLLHSYNLLKAMLDERQLPSPIPFGKITQLIDLSYQMFKESIAFLRNNMNQAKNEVTEVVKTLLTLIDSIFKLSFKFNPDEIYWEETSGQIVNPVVEQTDNSLNILNNTVDVLEKTIVPLILELYAEDDQSSLMLIHLCSTLIDVLKCQSISEQSKLLFCNQMFSRGYFSSVLKLRFETSSAQQSSMSKVDPQISRELKQSVTSMLAQYLHFMIMIDITRNMTHSYDDVNCFSVDKLRYGIEQYYAKDFQKYFTSMSIRDHSLDHVYYTFFAINYYGLRHNTNLTCDYNLEKFINLYCHSNSNLSYLPKLAVKHLLLILAFLETNYEGKERERDLIMINFLNDQSEQYKAQVITHHACLLQWSFMSDLLARSFGKFMLTKFIQIDPEELSPSELMHQLIRFIDSNQLALNVLYDLMCESSDVISMIESAYSYYDGDCDDAHMQSLLHSLIGKIFLHLPYLIIKCILECAEEELDKNRSKETKIARLITLLNQIRISTTFGNISNDWEHKLFFQIYKYFDKSLRVDTRIAILEYMKISFDFSYESKNDDANVIDMLKESNETRKYKIVYDYLNDGVINRNNIRLLETCASFIASITKCHNKFGVKHKLSQLPVIGLKHLAEMMLFPSQVIKQSAFTIISHGKVIGAQNLKSEESKLHVRAIFHHGLSYMIQNPTYYPQVFNFFLCLIDETKPINRDCDLYRRLTTHFLLHIAIETKLSDVSIFEAEEGFIEFLELFYEQDIVNEWLLPVTHKIVYQIISGVSSQEQMDANKKTPFLSLIRKIRDNYGIKLTRTTCEHIDNFLSLHFPFESDS